MTKRKAPEPKQSVKGVERVDTEPSPDSATPAEKRTPDEWAHRLGFVNRGGKMGSKRAPDFPVWQHGGASALHGWQSHAHHAQEPYRLTEADYRAALKAVESAPYTPHPGALSPHCRAHGG